MTIKSFSVLFLVIELYRQSKAKIVRMRNAMGSIRSQLQQPQQQHLRIPDCIQSSYRGRLRSNKRALER